jgi:hypothetical protein
VRKVKSFTITSLDDVYRVYLQYLDPAPTERLSVYGLEPSVKELEEIIRAETLLQNSGRFIELLFLIGQAFSNMKPTEALMAMAKTEQKQAVTDINRQMKKIYIDAVAYLIKSLSSVNEFGSGDRAALLCLTDIYLEFFSITKEAKDPAAFRILFLGSKIQNFSRDVGFIPDVVRDDAQRLYKQLIQAKTVADGVLSAPQKGPNISQSQEAVAATSGSQEAASANPGSENEDDSGCDAASSGRSSAVLVSARASLKDVVRHISLLISQLMASGYTYTTQIGNLVGSIEGYYSVGSDFIEPFRNYEVSEQPHTLDEQIFFYGFFLLLILKKCFEEKLSLVSVTGSFVEMYSRECVFASNLDLPAAVKEIKQLQGKNSDEGIGSGATNHSGFV